jgi:hypothetical protein
MHEGIPVLGRYYCQRHRVQLIVFTDGRVIEIPDVGPPAGTPGADVSQRLGSARKTIAETVRRILERIRGNTNSG